MIVWHFIMVTLTSFTFAFGDVKLMEEAKQPMPQKQPKMHVCRSTEMYNEMIKENMKHMEEEDTVFKFRLPGLPKPTESCDKYKYRPVRLLALTDLLKETSNITAKDFAKYKKMVQSVVDEFQHIFRVPYDHLADKGNATFRELLLSGCKRFLENKNNNAMVSVPENRTLNGDNIDMVIAVTYDLDCAGKSGTLAYATTCMPYQIELPPGCDKINPSRTRIYRHRAGTINICPAMDDQEYEYGRDTIRHELLHSMGFLSRACTADTNRTLFRLRKQEQLVYHLDVSKDPEPQLKWMERPVLTFVGGRVLKAARKHFNCSTLEGLPFEDTITKTGILPNFTMETDIAMRYKMCGAFSYHWDQYYFNHDLMVPANVGFLKFSAMTAAYFEDAYMYRINYSAIQNDINSYTFGKNYGCEFIQKGAMSWIEHNHQAKQSEASAEWGYEKYAETVGKNDPRTYCTFPLVHGEVFSTAVFSSKVIQNGELHFFKTFSDGNSFEATATLVFYSKHNQNAKGTYKNYFIKVDSKSSTETSLFVGGTENYMAYYPTFVPYRYVTEAPKMWGTRPAWCPTTPPERTMLNPKSGCVHEGLKGPDYKWCWNEWSQWSDCSVCIASTNCSLCTRERQREQRCDSYKASNCVGSPARENGTADCCLPPTTTMTTISNEGSADDGPGQDGQSPTATTEATTKKNSIAVTVAIVWLVTIGLLSGLIVTVGGVMWCGT